MPSKCTFVPMYISEYGWLNIRTVKCTGLNIVGGIYSVQDLIWSDEYRNFRVYSTESVWMNIGTVQCKGLNMIG